MRTRRREPTAEVCKHAELFDIPGQAVIATTLDGRIVYWGKAAAELYGWASDEAIGRHILEITPATQSHAEAEAIMAELRAGRTWRGRFLVRGRDGREFYVEVQDVPVRDAFGELVGIVGISQPA